MSDRDIPILALDNITFDATRYFPSSTDPRAFADAIALAQSDFEVLAERINESAESAADANKDVKDAFLNEHESRAVTIVQTIMEYITKEMDEQPGLSYALTKHLGEVTKAAREWSDMDISQVATQKRKDATEDRDTTLVDVAEQIRDHMKNLVSMVEAFLPKTDIDPDTGISKQWHKTLKAAGVHLTTRKVKGDNIATYPTTTKLQISDRTNVGRGAKYKHYRWSVDGEMLKETDPRAVILKRVHGSWSNFLEHLKAQGIDFGGESFKTTYQGHKIVASVKGGRS